MADPADEKARLSGARGEFVASLGRRLQTLRHALRELEEAPTERARRDSLVRRLHALGAAARVLGFASVAEALQEAERALADRERPRTKDLAEVSRVLDVLPSLVWGAPQSLRPGRPPSAAPEQLAGRKWPLSLLLYGGEDLAVTLTRAIREDSVDFERAEKVEPACRAARVLGPDLVLVDADHFEAREFLQRLASDELTEPVSSVVLGSFSEPESMREYSALGAARILKKPCNPETLRRTIEELSEAVQQRRVPHNRPLGDVTLPALTRRIQSEVERGLLDAAVAGAQGTHVPLGEGADVLAAVWGALTRVRELVTLHSKGQVRFEPTGPEGAIPVAPWSGEERRAGERAIGSTRGEADVPLAGRTVVVADDDPAVAWFLSGLLKTVGAEVVEAHDGYKALELARQKWPDLVVSDILMPGLDGFALCRELKQDVAVRDVPVILLSWKEDLLQRVRELGAGADGYLRKEAAASTVVQRIREVMRARARVEARLEQGGEVRGRLDGLTPRLVLELCSKSRANLRIEVIDAFHRYELHVRKGQLVAAKRVASGADADPATGVSGHRVVSSLLGVNAGRFMVTPDDTSVTAEFSGSLKDVLKPAIDRARVVQMALASDRLASVTRIHFLEEELNAYLAATPDPMRTALMQLTGGMTPRQLLLGGVSPELLERTLLDIARRGCITHVEGPSGPGRGAEAPAGEPGSSAPEGPASAASTDDHAPSAEPSEAKRSPAAGSSGPPALDVGMAAKAPAPVAPSTRKEQPADPSRAPPEASPEKPPEVEPPALDASSPRAPARWKSAPLRPAPPELSPLVASAPDPSKESSNEGAPAAARSSSPPSTESREKATEPEVKEAHPLDAEPRSAAKPAFSFQLSPEPPPSRPMDAGPASIEDIDDGEWFVSDSSLDADQVNPAWPAEAGTLPGVGDSDERPPEEVETRTPPPAKLAGLGSASPGTAAPGTQPSPRNPAARRRPKVGETPSEQSAEPDIAPDLASAIAHGTLETPPRRRERLVTKKSATLPLTKPIKFPGAESAGPPDSARAPADARGESPTASSSPSAEVAPKVSEPSTPAPSEPAAEAPELGATLLLGATPTPPPKPRVRPASTRSEAAEVPDSVEPALPASPAPEPSPAVAEPEARPAQKFARTLKLEPSPEPQGALPETEKAEVSEPHEPAAHESPTARRPHAEMDSERPGRRRADAGASKLEFDGDDREASEESPSPVPSSVPESSSKQEQRSDPAGVHPLKLGKVGLAVAFVASIAGSYLAVSAVKDWLGGAGRGSEKSPPAAAVDVSTPEATPPGATQPRPSSAPNTSQVPLQSELSAPAPKAKAEAKAKEARQTARANVSINEEALPKGMALAPGKGVLKVVTPDAHAIYVDGEFAGRGPVRIVPLPPGKHQVKIRFEGQEDAYAADVKAGRLTRFALGSK